ncbi:MAG: hypothetical protein ACR2OU_17020 [Thermomicrobiales bacterium]
MNHRLKGSVIGVRRRVIVTGLLAAALMCTMQVGIAAPATHAIHAPSALREQSANTSCSLTPLSLPLFNATPPNEIVGALASPMASPAVLATRPASTEEIPSVEVGLSTIEACINTGNPLLVYAVFSTRYLASQYADPLLAYLPAFEQQLGGVTIPIAPPFSFDPVVDMGVLADGRVQLTLNVRRGTEAWTDTLVLVNQEGTWLIDDVIS